MKLKLWITTLRPRVSTGEYPGGVRVSVHLSKRDALLDLCEWAYEDDEHDPEDDEAEGIPDFATAPEDELESYLERRQDEDAMQSWGVEDFEVDLPGTATERIAAILKATCTKGDELHAEEILREARGQFIRESDAAEYDGSHVETHCPECNQSKSECICDEECTCAERSWYGPEHDSACPFAGQPRESDAEVKGDE